MLQVEHWGYQAIAVSVATGRGMPQLGQALDGRISAVAGPSGVGKSSIINALRLTAQRQSQQAEHAGHAQQHVQQTEHGQQTEHAQQAGHTQHAHNASAQTEQRKSNGASSSSSPAGTVSTDERQMLDLDAVHSRGQDIISSHESNMQGPIQYHSDSPCTEHDTANLPDDNRPEGGQLPTPVPSQKEQSQEQWVPTQDVQSLQQQQSHLPAHQQRPVDSATTSQDWSRQSSSPPQPLSSHDSSNAESVSWHSAESHGGRTSSSASLEQNSTPGAEQGEGQGRQWGSEGIGEGVQLQSVGAMSNIGRGMHTTRHVALLKVCMQAVHCQAHMS